MVKQLTLHEFEQSRYIEAQGYKFYALIAAAMREADDSNLVRLKRMFPYIYDSLVRRYHEPFGVVEEWDGISPEEYKSMLDKYKSMLDKG